METRKNFLLPLIFLIFIVGFFGVVSAAITSITVTSPVGDDMWSEVQDITWTSDGTGSDKITIYWKIPGDGSAPITTVLATSGSYAWDTSSVDDENYLILIEDFDTGSVFHQSGQFTVDNTNPVVTIDPVDTPTATITQTITGTFTETNMGTITVNGVLATLETGTYSADVPLTEGSNTITATATDLARNTGEALDTITLDTIGPTVSVLGAPVGWLVSQTADAEAGVDCSTGDCVESLLHVSLSEIESCSTTYEDYTLTDPQTIIQPSWVCAAAKDYVDNEGFSSTPVKFKVSSTIQGAIDAAEDGDTISIVAGTYDEQLIITKSLTLEGIGDTTIVQPSQTTANSFTLFDRFSGGALNTAGIIVTNAASGTQITVKNMKVDGSLVSSTPSTARFIGILYRDAGGLIDSMTVEGININGGNGMYLSGYGSSVNVEVRNSVVSGYLKNGITANNPGMIANIHDNIITGVGPTPSIAQNGIQIGFGAVGTITNNIVIENVWTGTYGGTNDPSTDPDADGATGILLYMSGSDTIEISDNTLTGNQFGIWTVAATDVNIHDNTIMGLAHVGNAFPTGIAIWDSDMWTVSPFGGTEQSTSGTIENNIINSHDYGMIIRDFTSGGVVPSVEAHFNSIINNVIFGVWSDVLLNATLNWWGDANPSDDVSENVDYDPWYLDSLMTTLSSSVSLDTIYVDDGYTEGDSGVHYFGFNAFDEIQDAIDAVNEGGTVNVAAGTYTESLVIAKPLTLQGPNVGISPNTGSRVAEAVITVSVLLPSGADVNPLTIEGFTFQAPDPAVPGAGRDGSVISANGISNGWGNVIIRSNRFMNNYGPAVGVWATSGSVNSGWTITDNLIDGVMGTDRSGIYLVLDTLLTGWEISDNTIRNTQYGGIMVDGVVNTVVISGNTIEDVQKTGIQSSGSSENLMITGNVITRANLAYNVNPRAGIRLYGVDSTDPYGAGTLIGPVSVTNNIVTDSYIGFAIKDGHDIIGKVVHVNGNSFTGNSNAGVRHGGTGILDATNNWWGDASGPTHATSNPSGTGDSISDNVKFNPWAEDTTFTRFYAPVLNPIGNKDTAVEGSFLTFTITATDDDEDSLTYSASGLPTGASFNIDTQVFSWTPTDDDTDPVVTFTVGDGYMEDSEDVTITVSNADPVVETGVDQTADEGELVTIGPTFTDAGSADTHTATVNWGDESSVDNLGSVTSPITNTHIYSDDGSYIVTVTVTDDDGGIGSDTLTVIVNNVAPVVDAGADQDILVVDTVTLTSSFDDVGVGDTHTVIINWDDGNIDDLGTVTSPISFPHTYTDNGVYTVTVTVTDNDLDGGSDTLTVTVSDLVLDLVSGWNLISVPKTLVDNSLFGTEVWSYNTPGNSWGTPIGIDPGIGYWIQSGGEEVPINYEECGLPGGCLPSVTRTFYAGWNLIGHMSMEDEEQPVVEAIGYVFEDNPDVNQAFLLRYDGTIFQVNNLKTGVASYSFTDMTPGEGYWLYTSEEITYTN